MREELHALCDAAKEYYDRWRAEEDMYEGGPLLDSHFPNVDADMLAAALAANAVTQVMMGRDVYRLHPHLWEAVREGIEPPVEDFASRFVDRFLNDGSVSEESGGDDKENRHPLHSPPKPEEEGGSNPNCGRVAPASTPSSTKRAAPRRVSTPDAAAEAPVADAVGARSVRATTGSKRARRGRGQRRASSKGKREGEAEVLDLAGRRNKVAAVAEVKETRKQPALPREALLPVARPFVTDEVVVPAPPCGKNCYVLTSFALGRPAPSKQAIADASEHVRRGKGVELDDLAAALAAEASPLQLLPRPDIRHFDRLVAEPVGMFVGRGRIQTAAMPDPRLHYFSYDAGRKVVYDRPGELTLLEARDTTASGANALFCRRFAEHGLPNLGWVDLREVRQVMTTEPRQGTTSASSPGVAIAA